MKKLFILILPCLLAVCALRVSAAGQGWYCRRNREHRQPSLDPGQEILLPYGVYCDKNHTDWESDEKVVYLTFDAGYENGNVARILDVLREENVRASFFVLRHLVEHETDLVKRMAAEGHAVCNHTMSHPDVTALGYERFKAEVKGLEDLYREKTGNEMSKFFRPPEGKYNEETLAWAKELGYKTAMWSFAYADWDNARQPEPQAALQKILSNLHNGEIMLLHPTSDTNRAILRDLIRALKERGFTFATLDALG